MNKTDKKHACRTQMLSGTLVRLQAYCTVAKVTAGHGFEVNVCRLLYIGPLIHPPSGIVVSVSRPVPYMVGKFH